MFGHLFRWLFLPLSFFCFSELFVGLEKKKAALKQAAIDTVF